MIYVLVVEAVVSTVGGVLLRGITCVTKYWTFYYPHDLMSASQCRCAAGVVT